MITLVPRTATPYSRLAMTSGVAMLPDEADDEELADALVEDDFHRHAGIGAGEDGGEGFLFFGGLRLERLQVFAERLELPAA